MFPLHFAERSSRDVEEEEEESKDDDEDDGNDDTAHGSNAAISSLFTNFGREMRNARNGRTLGPQRP